MANGQNAQDQTAAKLAAIRASVGTGQPAPMPPISQPPVATDPTLTGIFSGIGPVMPSWPGANQTASVADPYQIASEDIGRQRAQAEKLVPLLARQEALSRPQSPDNPEGIPKQGPGIDKGRGFGHNLGEVLLTIANMTGPGRALNQSIYEPRKQAYARSSAEVAQQIQDIQKQEEIEQKPIGPMGELAYHQGLLGTREEQNRIRQQLADEKTKNDADRTDVERPAMIQRLRAKPAVSCIWLAFGKLATAATQRNALREDVCNVTLWPSKVRFVASDISYYVGKLATAATQRNGVESPSQPDC
jgi:hypothetical protein